MDKNIELPPEKQKVTLFLFMTPFSGSNKYVWSTVREMATNCGWLIVGSKTVEVERPEMGDLVQRQRELVVKQKEQQEIEHQEKMAILDDELRTLGILKD